MVTREQWLDMHGVCLDTIRGAIAGLADADFRAEPLKPGESIGSEVDHVIGAEVYWLREVGIEPAFGVLGRDRWSERSCVDELSRIERQYAQVLGKKGLDADVLFGLGRTSQHALYHHVRLMKFRKTLQPGWTGPLWPAAGSWERAVDFVTDLLIRGASARPCDPKTGSRPAAGPEPGS